MVRDPVSRDPVSQQGVSQEATASETTPVDAATEIDNAILRGSELEDAEMWGDAIRHYEKFTRQYPSDTRLYQRMIISRLHYDVNRRYQDKSFLGSLDQMSTSQALDLYSESLANLETHYVDTMDWSRVLIHGTAALEVALREDAFLGKTLADANPQAVEQFRDTIHKQLQGRSTETRFDLRAAVAMVAQRAQAELGFVGFGGRIRVFERSGFNTRLVHSVAFTQPTPRNV